MSAKKRHNNTESFEQTSRERIRLREQSEREVGKKNYKKKKRITFKYLDDFGFVLFARFSFLCFLVFFSFFFFF